MLKAQPNQAKKRSQRQRQARCMCAPRLEASLLSASKAGAKEQKSSSYTSKDSTHTERDRRTTLNTHSTQHTQRLILTGTVENTRTLAWDTSHGSRPARPSCAPRATADSIAADDHWVFQLPVCIILDSCSVLCQLPTTSVAVKQAPSCPAAHVRSSLRLYSVPPRVPRLVMLAAQSPSGPYHPRLSLFL